ncbi:MAG: NTP transferase domain-containing protein [Caldisphaeraceae archaeon]|nr:sugar phosphate nucleotidyltransferase [Caldisphaeraceae archaeon]MEB3798075.1 NTP transferase domain-containing protein [Caldisphaeraceae archaeon]
MKLVLMAAGFGERLRPLSETRQKALMPILGEPIICRHLRNLSKVFTFDEISIIISYKKEEVIEAVNKCFHGKVRFLVQEEPKGTGDAIKLAMESLGEGEYLIFYADVYLSTKGYSALANLESPGIMITETKDYWNYGIVELEDGIVKNITEKPSFSEAKDKTIFAGALMLDYDTKKYIDEIKKSPRGEFEITDALKKMANSMDIHTVNVGKYEWQDIGRPWELLISNRLALNESKEKQEILGDVDETVTIYGNVIIKKGSEIGKYSIIEGPAFIDENVKIGPMSHIRPYTVLMKGSKVGYSVEVKGSLIMENAKLPHFNYVGDSIIGEGVNLGAGTITANLRFDHEPIKMNIKGSPVNTGMEKLGAIVGGYSQTGINVSILPGKKIGSFSIIYPGCVVYRDVKPHEVFKCNIKTLPKT